jgi:hypothetical protein
MCRVIALYTKCGGQSLDLFVQSKIRADRMVATKKIVWRPVDAKPDAHLCKCEEPQWEETRDAYCFDHVNCENCHIHIYGTKKGEGPAHWNGQASAVTGQDVIDFQYVKRDKSAEPKPDKAGA